MPPVLEPATITNGGSLTDRFGYITQYREEAAKVEEFVAKAKAKKEQKRKEQLEATTAASGAGGGGSGASAAAALSADEQHILSLELGAVAGGSGGGGGGLSSAGGGGGGGGESLSRLLDVWPRRVVLVQGHLFDSKFINTAFDLIEKRGAFEILNFHVVPNMKHQARDSQMVLGVSAQDLEELEVRVAKLFAYYD